ncbi:DNA-binding domain-containing protein [Microbaculum marinum]|uniref:DNA-binding domain-containing protein n=1 Tax=Microbaculum marinum TaxID=1764581 RepID=A0AAW9RND6_9HYPH
MSSLADVQSRFAAAIRDRHLPPPADVAGRDGEAPLRRFGIYRNNVHVSLAEALMGTFPVVLRLVGEEFFRGMARVYVGGALPRTPVLIDYGGDFGDFIAQFAPATDLPYLPDVARLEWAWNLAYHAADATPVDAQALSAVPPERMADLTFDLHPSLQIVSSRWPVLAIWETNTNDEFVRPVDPGSGGGDVLILRPAWDVELRSLPDGGAAFIALLQAGRPLGVAYELTTDRHPGFDLAAALQGLIASGALAGLRL